MSRNNRFVLAGMLAAVAVAFALGTAVANGRLRPLVAEKRGVVYVPLESTLWYTIRIDDEHTINIGEKAVCNGHKFDIKSATVVDNGTGRRKHTAVKLRWDGSSLRPATVETGELTFSTNADPICVPVALSPWVVESAFESHPGDPCDCCETTGRRGLLRRR